MLRETHIFCKENKKHCNKVSWRQKWEGTPTGKKSREVPANWPTCQGTSPSKPIHI